MNRNCFSKIIIPIIIAVFIISTLFLCSCTKVTEDKYTPENFKTGKVGCIMGAMDSVYLTKLYPEMEISYYNTLADLIVALKSKRIDYASATSTEIALHLYRNPTLKQIDLHYLPCYIAFCTKKGNDEFLSEINGKIKEYKENGKLEEINSHWADCSNYIVKEIPKNTEGKVIVVATTGEMEPTNFIIDGKLGGFDIELIGNILYDLGYQVEFKTMAFGGLLSAVESGKADLGASDIGITDERVKAVDFSDVYIVRGYSAIVRDESAENVFSIASIKTGLYNNLIKEGRYKLLLGGLKMTGLLSLFSLIFGTLLGIILLLLKRSRFKLLSKLVSCYSVIIQGIPIVVLLLLVCYVLLGDVNASDIVIGMLTFGMFFSTGVLAALENGLNNIDKGQYEAAYALGYTNYLGLRKIILPQLLHNFLPIYRSELVAMIKATAIAGYVAIQDLTKAGDLIRSRTFDAFIPIIIVALIYFLIIWAVTLIIRRVETRDARKRKHRKIKL